MGAVRAKVSSSVIGWILLLTISHASSGQHTGVLSSLYKKAAQENRPLILVIDNGQNTEGSLDFASKKNALEVVKSPSNLSDYKMPFLLLQRLDLQTHHNLPSKSKNSHSITSNQNLRSKSFDKNRLRYNRDRREKDRDNKYRNGKHGESIKVYVEGIPKKDMRSRTAANDRKQVLRASVISNILRYNDDNCDVRPDDNCDFTEHICEIEVTCIVVPKEQKDKSSRDCEFSDTCGEEDKQISTKGVLLTEHRLRFK